MGDLLSDQRAIDLLAADPGVASGLVATFRSVAAQAQATAGGLHGAASDTTWTGNAADAFRQGLGQLPGELGKVTSSYQEAADGLSSFEGELSSLKPQFQNIVSQLRDAHAQLANAQNQLASATNQLTNAQNQAIHGVGNLMGGALHFLGNIGSMIIHPIVDLPNAIANFAQHRSLANLGKLAEDVAGSALLVATVVAPFAAPDLMAADAAMAGDGLTAASAGSKALTLQDLVKGANVVSKGAGYMGGSANVTQDVRGGNVGATVIDAGSMFIPDASNHLGVGDQQVKSAESTVDHGILASTFVTLQAEAFERLMPLLDKVAATCWLDVGTQSAA